MTFDHFVMWYAMGIAVFAGFHLAVVWSYTLGSGKRYRWRWLDIAFLSALWPVAIWRFFWIAHRVFSGKP